MRDRVDQAAFANIVTWVDNFKFSKLLDEKQVAKISELFAGSHEPTCLSPRTGGRRGNRGKWPRE